VARWGRKLHFSHPCCRISLVLYMGPIIISQTLPLLTNTGMWIWSIEGRINSFREPGQDAMLQNHPGRWNSAKCWLQKSRRSSSSVRLTAMSIRRLRPGIGWTMTIGYRVQELSQQYFIPMVRSCYYKKPHGMDQCIQKATVISFTAA